MAKLKFGGSDLSETTTHYIEVYENHQDEIYIDIGTNIDLMSPSWIVLDIPTAIQFSKHLRKSIANAKNNFRDEQG